MQKNVVEAQGQMGFKHKAFRFLLGLAIACLLTLGLFLLFAAVLFFGDIQKQWVGPIVTALALISVFLGARFAATSASKHPFWLGAALGVLYYVFIYIFALSCFAEFNFSVRTAIFMLIGGITGGLGGWSVQNRTEQRGRRRKKKR